jgi:hypothetical protein
MRIGSNSTVDTTPGVVGSGPASVDLAQSCIKFSRTFNWRSCGLLLLSICLYIFLLSPTPSPERASSAAALLPLAEFATQHIAAQGVASAAGKPSALVLSAEAQVQGLEGELLAAHGGAAGARMCSTYLAPIDPHEWAAPCDAACAEAELDAFGWNFGAWQVVDLSGGQGPFAAAASARGEGAATAASALAPPPITLGSLLRPSEEPHTVALAVLASRAMALLHGQPALFLLPTCTTCSGASSSSRASSDPVRAPPAWLLEDWPALPPALRAAAQPAVRAGLDALVAVLSSPAAVLSVLLPALAPAGTASPKNSSVVLLLPPQAAAAASSSAGRGDGAHQSLGPSDLNTLRVLLCALAPGWSLELQSGHLRAFPPLRAYAIPPRQIPSTFWGELTAWGAVPSRQRYYQQAAAPGGGVPLTVTYDNGTISVLLWKAGRHESEYYGITDQWLYAILDRHRGLLAGKRVGILGSLVPWYECIALSYGVGTIYTVEYGPRVSQDARFRFITPAAMEAQVAAGTWEPFDVALSISSFEHDGLGRYGDPLRGDGDLDTMAFVRQHVVKPGGHLLFAVPFGRDCVVFNEQRVYGIERMPRILQGWTVVDSEGLDWGAANAANVCEQWFQPVFLLQSPAAAEEAASEAGE